MVSIFKLTTTRAVPSDAHIVTKRGKQFIRLERSGRAVLKPFCPCGTKYRDESRNWYIKYKNRRGKWQRVPGYSGSGATEHGVS